MLSDIFRWQTWKSIYFVYIYLMVIYQWQANQILQLLKRQSRE